MIILDSSFLVAFHNTLDARHGPAGAVMADLLDGRWGSILLPEYVFLEVVTVLARRVDLEAAASVGDILLHAREIEFVPCIDFFHDAFGIFKGQPNSVLSFADAAIVAIARAREAKFVATFDSGFRAVPGITVVPG